MTISEQQLEAWASAPSPTEMQRIRNSRTVIEDILKKHLPVDAIKNNYNLSNFTYEVYLQGSYANSTNIRFDSDADIVVQLNNPFFPNKLGLNAQERALYDLSHSDSQYKFEQFKRDVFDALVKGLSSGQAHWDNKCINVDENTYRVEADIVPCLQYRLYKRFVSHDNQSFIEGIKFFDTSTNSEIVNFPKIHLKNCEAKNIDAAGKFKDLVRIYKSMRSSLVEAGVITNEIAPSYFIENLLYNCTSPCFDGNYGECMIKSLQFIFDALQTGRVTGFICANEQDSLISPKTWNLDNLIAYMNAIGKYYLGEITI